VAERPGATATASPTSPKLLPTGVERELRAALVLLALSVVIVLASRALGPSFGTLRQIQAILVIASFTITVAFGQQMVILVGGLDLSVGSLITLGGVLAYRWIGPSPLSLLFGIPLVLLVTGAVGAMSGLGVALLRIPPFIMTLAMGIIVYGVVLGVTGGLPRGQASPPLAWLFSPHHFGPPAIVYIIVIFAILGTLLQTRTAFGRRVYALGSSPRAAYIAGLPVHRLTIACYAIGAASAGATGVLIIGYVGGATLMMGQSYLLPSVAAAVVGGTAITGGRGIFLGAVGGAVLLTALSTTISSLGIAEGWRNIIYGVVILLALILLRDQIGSLFRLPRRSAAANAPRQTIKT
jgi:ribose transport system permease protein